MPLPRAFLFTGLCLAALFAAPLARTAWLQSQAGDAAGLRHSLAALLIALAVVGAVFAWLRRQALPAADSDAKASDDATEGLQAELARAHASLAAHAQRSAERKAYQEALLDAVPMALALRDPEGKVLFVNRAWQQAFNREALEVIGTAHRRDMDEATAALLDRQDGEALALGAGTSPPPLEVTVAGRTWMRRSTVLADGAGAVVGVLVASLDITELAAARQALALERQRVDLLIRFAGLGTLEWDVASGTRILSPRLKEMLGFAADADLAQRDFFAFVHPDDRRPCRAAFLRHLRGEPAVTGARIAGQLEYRLVRTDGDVLWVHSEATVLRGIDGRALLYSCSFLDITRSRRDELQLLFNRRVVENAGPMLWIAPEGERLVYANRAAHALLGRETEDLRGIAMAELDAGAPGDYAAFEARLRGQAGTLSAERTYRRPDGSTLQAELVLSAAHDDERSLLVAVLADITERKRAAEAMEHAKVLAEEASRMKSDFLANMSHEIRTPMNAILGMAHLALQSGLDTRQRNYVEKIASAARSLLGIINDILDFSKIEAGRMQVEHVPLRLQDVLEQVGDVCGLRARDKGLALVFDLPPDVPAALVGDPLRLGQVLVNLVGNAVKFTPQGEVRVAVALHAYDAGGVTLRFAVSDTGVGLAPAQSQRLFDAFAQGDSSATRPYGGAGLGLSISKRLVEMMGGEIGVESAPGRGSTFHFTARLGLQG